MTALSQSTIKRLMLSRYFLHLAGQHAKSSNDLSAFAAVNMLQDSVEYFLNAASEHLNAKIVARTEFAQYLDAIDKKLEERAQATGQSGQALPHRQRLIQINKLRVSAKHDGIKPDQEEVRSGLLVVQLFLEEAAKQIFSVNFSTVSLVDLLDDGESKGHLVAAVQALENNSYGECLVECRKAIFFEFFSRYDIKWFETTDSDGWLAALISSAPYYAKNKEYIAQNVGNPFQYIVMDHDQIDREISKNGSDHKTFWNIWRLTPEVYRHNKGPWAVKNDLHILQHPNIQENAVYVLSASISVVLDAHFTRRGQKFLQSNTTFIVTLFREGIPIYSKADRNSTVVAHTPPGMTTMGALFSCEGLSDGQTYWSVSQPIGLPEELKSISGYALHDDLKWD